MYDDNIVKMSEKKNKKKKNPETSYSPYKNTRQSLKLFKTMYNV